MRDSMGMTVLSLFFLFISYLQAADRTPLPYYVFDSEGVSADTISRGNTFVSNIGSFSSGSENPASLSSNLDNSALTTLLVKTKSSFSKEVEQSQDILHGNMMRYLSMGGEKGLIFFEPVSRLRSSETFTTGTFPFENRTTEFNLNAIGIAGGSAYKIGDFGISLSYLFGNISVKEKRPSQNEIFTTDTTNGVRMNFGFRVPYGPFMVGLSAQNAPAFLWWKGYKRDQLPTKLRAGTTLRLGHGILISIDQEQVLYKEGSLKKDYTYIGSESYVGSRGVVRFGVYGEKIDKPEKRHYTTGFTFKLPQKMNISYALDTFKLNGEKIKVSVISVLFPIHP
ncbi:MAG: hypothetical protein ACKVQC_10360 [Elusimicrobiota bacterium]